MSYDVFLRGPKCDKCGHRYPEPECWEPTYNLGPIFTLLLTGNAPGDDYVTPPTFTKGKGFGLGLLSGMTGEESIPFLEIAVKRWSLLEFLEKMEKLKAPNGWGTPNDALEVLQTMLRQAKEYPQNTWDIR